MQKKKIEREIEQVSYIDRNTTHPCINCRKRDSCLIKPYKDRCTGFEEGTPWSLQYPN